MQHYQEAIALGSKTGLSLVSQASPAEIAALYQALWQQIFAFERRFSRFLPGSELSVFNRSAGTKLGVSPMFRDILLAARESAHQSHGLYNPFILPALQAAGYRQSRVPGREQDAVDDHSHKIIAAIDMLEIGDDWARIPFGTALDLGGCGKGYLAEQLRQTLPAHVTGYWLSFGGDIAVGGADADNKPWTVGVQHVDPAQKDVATITIVHAGGVATSGTTVHAGKKDDGTRWHHIIDPRTNQPAVTDIFLATVWDESPLRADVLASCAIILGSREGRTYLQANGVRGAVLQYRSPHDDLQVLTVGSDIIMNSHYA